MVTPHTLRVDFEGRTGLTPSFDFLKDHSDANVAASAITEIAGTDGIYKFTIVDIDGGAFGRVDPGDGGAGASFDIGPEVLETLAADLATIDGKVNVIDTNVDATLADTAAMQPLVDVATSTRATPVQVGAELDSRRLDDLVADGSAGDPVVGSLLDQVMNKDGSQTFDKAIDSLEAQSDRLQICVPVGQRVVVLTLEDDVSGDPIVGALVTVRTDPGGALILANQLTDGSGQITVNLDDDDYTITASRLPDYLSFTPTIFTVTNVATAFTFTGTSTIPPPPPAGDPIKCNVIADSFQNVVEGMKAEASIIGEDVMTIGNNLLDEAEATVKVTADSAGRFTFPLIRATQLKQSNGVAVTYRVRIRDIGFDAKILVPDLATAFLGDIITAN